MNLSGLRVSLPSGDMVPAARVFALPNYTGFEIYNGFEPIGEDLPPSCYRSVWFNPCCAYCGAPKNDDFESDHIIPRRHGGANGGQNLAPACRPCNQRKAHALGWTTRDGRTGFYWNGLPWDGTAHPRPRGARERDPLIVVWPPRLPITDSAGKLEQRT